MVIRSVHFFFFSSRRRHTRWPRDWSSDVCSSDLMTPARTQKRIPFFPDSSVIEPAKNVLRLMPFRTTSLAISRFYLPPLQRVMVLKCYVFTLCDQMPRVLAPYLSFRRVSRGRQKYWEYGIIGGFLQE